MSGRETESRALVLMRRYRNGLVLQSVGFTVSLSVSLTEDLSAAAPDAVEIVDVFFRRKESERRPGSFFRFDTTTKRNENYILTI